VPKNRPGLEVVTRKGRASLYVRGTVRSISVFESAGTDDPRLAEEYRAAREAEIYRSAVHGAPRQAVTFAVAALSYLEADSRSPSTRHAVGRLVKHFGAALSCDDVNQEALDGAARVICRHGSKPTTVLRQVIAPARAILTHAAARSWCAVPAFQRVKSGARRTDWFTPAEAEALIAGAAPHLRPLIAFLFCTGARLNEALTLDWSDVDLQHARAVFRDTKSGADRIVDLPPRAVATLASLAGDKARGRVFRARAGKPYRDTNSSRTVAYGGQIANGFASAMKRAGIARRLTPHHCRHTWATWHYCLSRDPMQLRDDGGWSSLSQVERYAKLAPIGMRDAVVAFWGVRTKSVPRETREPIAS